MLPRSSGVVRRDHEPDGATAAPPGRLQAGHSRRHDRGDGFEPAPESLSTSAATQAAAYELRGGGVSRLIPVTGAQRRIGEAMQIDIALFGVPL